MASPTNCGCPKNIAKSSSFEENHLFISDICIFKAKDPQLFDKQLEQMDRVISLTNKQPYELTLAKTQGSFSRMISSFLLSMDCHKIKEHLCYNFGSVVTKQHVSSMLIDQQQIVSETLQECKQRFLDLLLISSSLLPHQAKDLAHITHFIHNLPTQILQHYMLGINPTSAQNAIMLAQKKYTDP